MLRALAARLAALARALAATLEKLARSESSDVSVRALRQRFPGAPDHWLRLIQSRAPQFLNRTAPNPGVPTGSPARRDKLHSSEQDQPGGHEERLPHNFIDRAVHRSRRSNFADPSVQASASRGPTIRFEPADLDASAATRPTADDLATDQGSAERVECELPQPSRPLKAVSPRFIGPEASAPLKEWSAQIEMPPNKNSTVEFPSLHSSGGTGRRFDFPERAGKTASVDWTIPASISRSVELPTALEAGELAWPDLPPLSAETRALEELLVDLDRLQRHQEGRAWSA